MFLLSGFVFFCMFDCSGITIPSLDEGNYCFFNHFPKSRKENLFIHPGLVFSGFFLQV